MGHGNATMHEEPTQVPIPFSSTFAATTQKPSRPGIWDHYRLPQTLVPINYQLELWPRLDPDYDGTYRFTGEANITFQCKEETDIILLHISHLNVTVSQLEIVSGDVTIREDENGHKWNVTTFSTTPKMSTYITAFVVCEFDYVSKFEGSNEIRVWARKSAIENGEADYALNVTGPILTHLEHFFNWFGNLVTMNWWNHLWLNEGLATFVEYLVPHYVEPQMKLNELHAFADMQEMFSTDSFLMSQPLTVKEEEIRSHQILPMFNLVTYNKGASIVRMAASFLTKKVFQKGLSSYLQNFSYMTVEQDNLWNHWQKAERSFSEEEEEKLQSAFSLEKQDLQLILETVSFILEQAVYHNVKPASLQQQLENVHLNPEKAEAFAQAWATTGQETVEKFRQRMFAPKKVDLIRGLLSVADESGGSKGVTFTYSQYMQFKVI
ncbi:Aminopeptidase Q [Acipenser ruthenus]|uniref:Aminopeptidase Q n=1 Tax=Acipenser ruthenus TaxID=7906 RepID=A0A444V7C9_ACIRT|nr:Aminopeptidase Q [Acipenser ruthenus]